MTRLGWKGAAAMLMGRCAAVAILDAASASGHERGSDAAGAADRSIARQIDRWSRHIDQASSRFGVPEEWIRRVMRAESGGRTMLDGRPITSSAGAMGLMQLMPGTWSEMRARYGLGRDPHRPSDNILAGTAYLRLLYDRFGYPGLFAAYHAGPSRYADHLLTGRTLPAETLAYVAEVGGGSARPVAAAPMPGPSQMSPLFVTLAGDGGPSPDAAASDAPSPLLVALTTASRP